MAAPRHLGFVTAYHGSDYREWEGLARNDRLEDSQA